MSSSSITDYKLQSGKSGTIARRVLMHTFEADMTIHSYHGNHKEEFSQCGYKLT